jgi:FkbM family methyltransferase
MHAERKETIKRLVAPGLITDLREMRAFARRHSVRLAGLSGYTAFREARKFGLDLLPPMTLDGLVVDVGANEGQFASALLAIEPRAHLSAFEPEPVTADRLRRRFVGNGQLTVHQKALGNFVGTSGLHVTGNTVFASLHKPLSELAIHYPSGANSVGVIDVDTTTLDETVFEPVRLLKIDVQGGEADVLAGASRVLETTDAVLVELNFIPHYDNEASFAELHDTMLAAGLVLYDMGEPKRSSATKALLWTDACYVPATRRFR